MLASLSGSWLNNMDLGTGFNSVSWNLNVAFSRNPQICSETFHLCESYYFFDNSINSLRSMAWDHIWKEDNSAIDLTSMYSIFC